MIDLLKERFYTKSSARKKLMNTLGYAILAAILLIQIFEVALTMLNRAHTRRISRSPAGHILEFYQKEKIVTAADYQLSRSALGLVQRAVKSPLFFALFLTGFLVIWSQMINQYFQMEFYRAVVFFGSYTLFFYLISLPFTLYDTFVLEKKFQFNQTTGWLFVRDTFVSLCLTGVVSGIALWAVITFIQNTGSLWWLYAAVFMTGFSLCLTYIYPTFIAPLFNRFEALEDGSLKDNIHKLAQQAGFPLSKIFKMDASRRSSHSNAYFTGLGRKKRIVLFDTLLEKHSENEILAILAHEIGHYKMGHIRKMLILNIVGMFIGAYVVGLLINEDFIYLAFGFDKSVTIGLFLISVMISPVAFILTPMFAILSRKYEYQADRFALKQTGDPEGMVTTLARLHRDNLANPDPQPLYAFFTYSHPTLLDRIKALRQ